MAIIRKAQKNGIQPKMPFNPGNKIGNANKVKYTIAGRTTTFGITKHTMSSMRSFLLHLFSYKPRANSMIPVITMIKGNPQTARFLKIDSINCIMTNSYKVIF